MEAVGNDVIRSRFCKIAISETRKSKKDEQSDNKELELEERELQWREREFEEERRKMMRMEEKMEEENKDLEMEIERLEKEVVEVSESSFYFKQEKKENGKVVSISNRRRKRMGR